MTAIESVIDATIVALSQQCRSDFAPLHTAAKRVRILSALSTDAVERFWTMARLRQFSAGEVVLENSGSESLVLLLKGDVVVLAPDSGTDSPRKTTKAVVRDPLIELYRLSPFDTFGDSFDPSHNYTLVTKSPSLLCFLSRSQYQEVLQLSEEQKTQEKVEYFRSLPLFAGWSKSLLRKLSASARVATYRRQEAIYREGDAAKDVFFIVEGEVLVRFTQLSKSFDFDPRSDGDYRKPRSLTPMSRRAEPSVSKKDGKLCVKQARELFGDEEEPARTTTCTCVSLRAMCYVIAKTVRNTQDFGKRVVNPATVNFLSLRRKLENRWVRGRLQSLKNAEKLRLQPAPAPDPPHRPSIQSPRTPLTPQPQQVQIFLTSDVSALTPLPVTGSTEDMSPYSPCVRLFPELPAKMSLSNDVSPRVTPMKRSQRVDGPILLPKLIRRPRLRQHSGDRGRGRRAEEMMEIA